ncbi:MAG: ATP-binding protein, partial [Treponema sp.]|nr:ATP-binding protein [Treponema sp.]
AATIEEKNSALDKIDDASSHLLGVINDILDMAKIEADKLELTLVEYSFEKLVQRVLSVIAFRADEKRQKLAVNISDEIPRCVVGDAQHLAQVITNLLSNAVKFTSEGGEIHLDAFAAQGQTGRSLLLRVEVTDNGIGISREQQEKMFDAFEQVQSGTSREHGGTGLGLAISKRIIELMGGRIWVESELGKGAKFIFTVEVQRGTSNGGAGSATQTAAESAPHNYFPGKRLLIAEDIAINRQILVTLLEDSGLAIDCAETGSEALELVAAAPDKYDIVFMDLQMPHMNGLEATRHIRALPAVMRRRKKLPIIAMTANVFKEDIAACRAAGMDDHLSKPLDIAKMQDVLRTYLGED